MRAVLCPTLSGVLWIHTHPTFLFFPQYFLILQIYDLKPQGSVLIPGFQLMFKARRRRRSGWSSLLFFKKCQQRGLIPENELFFIADILLVMGQLRSRFGGRAHRSSRLLHNTLLALLGNDKLLFLPPGLPYYCCICSSAFLH